MFILGEICHIFTLYWVKNKIYSIDIISRKKLPMVNYGSCMCAFKLHHISEKRMEYQILFISKHWKVFKFENDPTTKLCFGDFCCDISHLQLRRDLAALLFCIIKFLLVTKAAYIAPHIRIIKFYWDSE